MFSRCAWLVPHSGNHAVANFVCRALSYWWRPVFCLGLNVRHRHHKVELIILSLLCALPASAQKDGSSLTPQDKRGGWEHATMWPVQNPQKTRTPEDMLRPFLSETARKIYKLWTQGDYPDAKLTCRFRMKGTDKVTQLVIVKSSGSKKIDQSALACIQNAMIDRCPDRFNDVLVRIDFTGKDRPEGGALVLATWIHKQRD